MEVLKRLARFSGILLMAAILSAVSITMSSKAQAQTVRLHESKIMAGLLYNFLKYTTWPPEGPEARTIDVCLVGGDLFEGALDPLQGRTAQQRVIMLRRLDPNESLQNCDVVAVHASEKADLKAILDKTTRHHILTISNIDNFAERGGMVEFTRSPDQRINIKINKRAINLENLQIGERLLKLASIAR